MTTPTPSDFRALCAELVDWARMLVEVPDPPVTRSADELSDLLARARAALEAQPEPVGPTDEQINQCYAALYGLNTDKLGLMPVRFGRELLARWGRPAIEPIPVSERLPGPEDCDAEGRCWWFDRECDAWSFYEGRLEEEAHWLPHWALPIPRSEENLNAT